MAGYPDNRDLNMDIKQMRRVLSDLDERINVPDSIRGEALRRKIDDINPPVIASNVQKERYKPSMRWLNWKSGMVYAAAFALIVALFYGLGMDRPGIVDGGMELEGAEQTDMMRAVPQDAEADLYGAAITDLEPFSFDEDAVMFSENADMAVDDQAGGVGGVRASVMNSDDGLTWAWRQNDPTDPDKGQYAVTIDIVNTETTELTGQIDLLNIRSILEYGFEEDLLVLTGPAVADEGIQTEIWDVSNPEQPVQMHTVFQPGEYVASHINDGIRRVITYADIETAMELQNEELPWSTSEGACVITATDLQGGATVQKAWLKSGRDIRLYNLHAYIYFEGMNEEEEETPSTHIAQIRFEGLELSTGSVS